MAMFHPLMSGDLARRLKTSLDELRMQVLGAQVLLGFQFQSLFQDRFQQAGPEVQSAAGLGLVAICLSLAGLIAPPAQHRLVEQGRATLRILSIANRCAEVSLVLFSLALGSDIFVAASLQGSSHPLIFACGAILLSMSLWFGAAAFKRPADQLRGNRNGAASEEVDMHTKIEQMLTEARVILPGAQAMLGFQLIVTLSTKFYEMAAGIKTLHFVALGALILSVVLLITPAAVHRLRFAGSDDPRFYRIGSWLITAALVPLAGGIALDLSVAAWRLFANGGAAAWAGLGGFAVLMGLWYVWPLALRRSDRRLTAD
jgi:Family of unknown function (DUF6328)